MMQRTHGERDLKLMILDVIDQSQELLTKFAEEKIKEKRKIKEEQEA
jgi:hypothetical protein